MRIRKRHCAECFETFFPTRAKQTVCKRCRVNKVRKPVNDRVQNFKKTKDHESKSFHKGIEADLLEIELGDD